MLTNTWDPFFDFFELKHSGPARSAPGTRLRGLAPTVDVLEEEKAFLIEAELPGVRIEDVELNVDKSVLTLRAERRRGHGTFARSFTLPEAVDASAIEAELEDGVLTVRLPKKAAVLPRRVTVKARSLRAPSERLAVKENGAAREGEAKAS
jgi:HSP20 family protein